VNAAALDVITARWPEDPLLDIALTHALLHEVAAGRHAPAVRVFRPGPTVAFGRLDALRPGFAEASRRARAHGYVPVVRPAGGHAAVYDGGSVLVEQVTAEADATAGLQDRFARLAQRLRDALTALGADARVGALPGEYCPGAFSLNLGGGIKVAGIAQRVVRHAALTTATVTASGGADLRATVAAVYDALALEVDASVAGAVDEALPGVTPGEVQSALREALGPLRPRAVDAVLLDRARELKTRHAAP
jgi:lipoate-protein ligase A